MELYLFLWGALAWTVTIAALWPVNVPVANLAYRIWSNNKLPPDTEPQEMWVRSTLATLAIGVSAVVMTVVDNLLVDRAELPAGPVHFVIYASLIGLAAWMMMLFFEIEDFFAALGLVVIYFYLPWFVLYVINWLLGVWNPLLNYVFRWLREPTG